MTTPISETIEVWNIRFTKKDSSRQILREILSRYMDCDPASLSFDRNENGKPFLSDSEIRFNLSHSRDRLLIAVTAGREVGIDIEFRRTGVNMAAIAERWFSEEEKEFFQGLDLSDSESAFGTLQKKRPAGERQKPETAFFDIWSKKEAFVKAQGLGIFHGLSDFTVPLDTKPGFPNIGKNEEWFFQTLEIHPDCAAALVSHTPIVPVQQHEFHL